MLLCGYFDFGTYILERCTGHHATFVLLYVTEDIRLINMYKGEY